MRYSPSTGGCYPETLNYSDKELPKDLVTFDDDLHAEWCSDPSKHLEVQDGKVVLVDGILPPPEEVSST